MVDTWTEKDEQEALALLARKAKLLNPDRRALVDVLSQVTVGLYADPVADMLIERAAEFRRLLEPFDPPAQEAIRFTDVSGWIEWPGHKRPLAVVGRNYMVRLRNGTEAAGNTRNDWRQDGSEADIVAYKVLP